MRQPEASGTLLRRGWLQEVVGFPEVAEKDRVDAMSMAALERMR